MPLFLYDARDALGRPVRGALDAASTAELLGLLERRGLRGHRVRRGGASPEGAFRGNGALSREDLAALARQVRALHAGGIPLARGLEAFGRDAGGGPPGRAARGLAAAMEEGRTFADALARDPRAFPDWFVAAAAAGERSGRLGEILEILAAFLEREEEAARETRTAARYPMFVLLFCAVAVIAVFGFALPAVRESYAALGVRPPAFSESLFRLRDLVAASRDLFAGGAALLALLAALALGTRAGAEAAGWLLLRAPLLRTVFGKPEAARFTGFLAVLRRAGIPLPEAVGLAGRAQGNAALRAGAARVARGMERGGDLPGLLLGGRLFPRALGEAAASASAGADLGDALDAVARRLEAEVRHDLRRLGSTVGPAILGLAALAVLALILTVDLTLVDRLRSMSLAGG